MRLRATVIGLAGALALGTGSSARAATQCQMQELAELPVNVDGPMNTIEVQINGQPARMLVDTGSSFPFLLQSGAARLNLAPAQIPGYTEVTSYGVGGKGPGGAVRIKELKVGGLVARNLDMLLSGQGLGGGVDGVLGATFLLQTDVEFDLPEGKIRFFKPRDCAGDQVVYWGKAYSVAPLLGDSPRQIVVIVSLDGAPIRTLMDTGASASVVTPAAAARAGITIGSLGGTASQTIRGLGPRAVRSGVGVFPTFAFGSDETIKNAKMQIADLFHADKETPIGSNIPVSAVQEQMLLGSDFFRAHRVYVARSQGKVYVSYSGGPVFLVPGAASPAPTTAPAPAAK